MKPFYYREIPDGIAFASEIKALLELGRPSIDRLALRDYLTYKYVPEPKTAFSGNPQSATGSHAPLGWLARDRALLEPFHASGGDRFR